MTPTARTLAECRKLGWTAEVVERWNPHSRTRKDLFGFIDIVALMPEEGAMLAIQATSASNVAARKSKIRDECADQLKVWRACGGRVEVWGWAKQGPRGKRKLWTLRKVGVP